MAKNPFVKMMKEKGEKVDKTKGKSKSKMAKMPKKGKRAC